MVGRISATGAGLAIRLTLLLAVSAVMASAEAPLEQAVGQRMEGNRARVASQKTIDRFSDETDKLTVEYRGALHQIGSLRVYNRQISGLIASQETEASSLREQLENVALVGRQVTPLMLEMIEALAAFIELDVPFLLQERRARVQALQELMDRADVTDAERYRQILRAYQIENDYGRSIEAYKGELTDGESSRAVDFLRIGRVVLLYQTLDGSETGSWDPDKGAWLPAQDYRSGVREGLRMARKQTAPDLLKLPVPAAKVGSERAEENPRP